MLLHLINAYQNWTLFNIYLFTFHLSSVELDNHLLETINICSPGLSHLNLTFNNIILLLRLLTSVYKYS